MSYTADLFKAAEANTDFRRVLYTTDRTQLVLMTVQPGDDIGMEVHDLDQVLVFVSGRGESILAGARNPLGAGTVVVVPAGVEHNIVNTGTDPLKLFTVYAPPEHADGTIHRTKAEADEAESAEHGHGHGHASSHGQDQGQGSAPSRPLTVGSLKGTPQP